ncbi:hypothetical protein AB4090_05180 [Acidithiobacillus sp. IBUN Pt1247-S3]|uniref:hypothetical protein n=1 Tax=Acidithiobacillus sp. IBUN Pt1247-S3 TaxID=3166642 RepID=UPI0034E41C98
MFWSNEDRLAFSDELVKMMRDVYRIAEFDSGYASTWMSSLMSRLSFNAAIEALEAHPASPHGRFPPKPIDLIEIVEALNGGGKKDQEELLKQRIAAFPTPDMAWSYAQRAFNEEDSILWTDEIRRAYGEVRHMDDRIAQRRAFLDFYTAAVRQSALSGRMPRWDVSLGWDRSLQRERLREALQGGLLERRDLNAAQLQVLEDGQPMSQPMSNLLDAMSGEARLTDTASPRAASGDREADRDEAMETRNWKAYSYQENLEFFARWMRKMQASGEQVAPLSGKQKREIAQAEMLRRVRAHQEKIAAESSNSY